MKLSTKTTQILSSFCGISPHILIKKGSVLRTTDTESNTPFIAIAKTDDSFDQEFAVYDLPSLLGVVKMFNDPEIAFHDDYLDITYGATKARYGYTNPTLVGQGHIDVHENEPKLADTLIEFEITEDMLKNTLQAANVMKLPDITIRSNDNNGIELVARDVSLSSNTLTDTTNEYVTLLDTTYDGPNFTANYLAHQVNKIIKNDYNASIGFRRKNSGVLTLKNDDIHYMMASQITTDYNGEL